MKRSRRVHDPRYQELYSAPKNKKVVMVWVWGKNLSKINCFLSSCDHRLRIVANLILGLLCRSKISPAIRKYLVSLPTARMSATFESENEVGYNSGPMIPARKKHTGARIFPPLCKMITTFLVLGAE